MGRKRKKTNVSYKTTKNGGTVKKVTHTISSYTPPKRKKSQQKDSNCWVATAYYGDKFHPNVKQLRYFRENLLIKRSIAGISMLYLNKTYLYIGKTSFGKWWEDGLQNNNSNNKRKFISYFILKFLLYLSSNS